MKLYHVMVSILLVTHVTACGGGGGSGEGEGSSTGVRVLHGAIDAVPVEVVTAGASPEVVSKGTFALPSRYGRVSGGEQVLNISRAGSTADVITSVSASLDESKRYSVLLYGGTTLQAKIEEDSVPQKASGGASGSAFVRIAAAATGIAFSRVSVGSEDGTIVVPFGEFSSYVEVLAGARRITVRNSAGDRPVATVVGELQAGAQYTVLIAGEADYFVQAILLSDE